MNIKGNLKYVVIGSVLFLLIYMLIAAIPMGSDIYFEPVWTKDITVSVQADETFTRRHDFEAFSLGDHFGYFTPDGEILFSAETADRVTVSQSAWATYPEDAASTEIRNPDGSPRMTIAASGFTFLDGGHTYLFLPGGDGVREYADDGSIIWTREHTAPITAFNSSPKGTVIGYADGQLSCINPDGTEIFSFYPGGSDYQVILGAALSDDGTLIACVCGLDRQRIVLIRVSGDQYKVVFHTYLEGNLRRQAFVDFAKSGGFVFFEYSNGLGIIDCKKNTASLIPFEGRVVTAGECANDKIIVALIKKDAQYTLATIERPDHLVAKTSFSAENAFLLQRGEAMFLGTDTRISRINIRGMK